MLLCLTRCAQATLYLQDGFNYSTGVLGGQAPWSNAASQINVATNALTYSNFATIAPNNSAVITAGSAASSYRLLGTAFTNGTVYYSCLLNFSVLPNSYYISGLTQASNTPPGGSADDPLDLVNSVSGSGYKLGIRGKGISSSYNSNVLSLNTTYFLVMKYDFSTGNASLYINPAPGSTEPAAPSVVSSNGAAIADLSYLYLRSGGSQAGTFYCGDLRVGSGWSDVTPVAGQSNVLVFTAQPSSTVAGNTLTSVSVQLQDGNGNNVVSNNVPVVLSLNGAGFASGTTTVTTGATGLAAFNNLVITNAGTYTIGASATGFANGTSSSIVVNPAAINHYSVVVPASTAFNTPFAVTGAALDAYGNLATTNNSTVVTLSSSGNVLFDGNQNGVFGQTGDNLITLSAGTFSLNAEDNVSEIVTVTVSDANGKTGTSGSLVVSSNGISNQGMMLMAFLNSLRVDQYWLVGTSVNFLTGAAGGSGPNMTLGTDSHCSAFSGSVANLLGIYLLRPPQASDLNLANNQAVWFLTNTAGWFPITNALNAQHMVNTGLLVVASYDASSGSGHSAVLIPTTRTDADVNTFGPQECQSGDNNYYSTNVMAGFSEHSGAFPNGIKYYGHTVNYPISPIQPAFNQGAITNHAFTSTITTLAGRKYQVQWSSNLTAWSSLATFTNNNSPSGFYTNTPFSDASITNSARYYRVMAQ